MTSWVSPIDRARLNSPRISVPTLSGFCTIVLLVAALVGPILAARYPLFHDYPEHLARMWVIATIDHTPLLQKFYAIHWQLLPNLAMDIMVPPLVGLLGLDTAGKLFYLVSLTVLFSGVYGMQFALFRRLTLWPLVGFLFVHNKDFDAGLLNYIFAVGLSLWAFAIWIWLRERDWRLRLAVSLLLSAVLYTSHLFGLAFYGLLVTAFEGWRLYSAGRGKSIVGDAAAFALPFLAMLALLMIGTTSSQSGLVWDAPAKLLGLYGMVSAYDQPLDTAARLIAVAGLAWALWTRRLRLHPIGWIVLAVALVVYPTMPTMIFGSWGADARFPSGLSFAIIGLAQLEMKRPSERLAFCAALLALGLLEFVGGLAARHREAAFVADLERSFDKIEPGSRILVTRERTSGLPWNQTTTYFHVPSLAIIDRSALTSNVYSHPGHHILSVKPPYRATSDESEDPPPIIDDVVAADRDPGSTHRFFDGWRQSYDYVYVLFAKPDAAPPVAGLSLLYVGPKFQLYRIER